MGSCGADNPIPKAESLSQCKKRCKKRCKAVAKDLGYGYDVVDAIKQAKSNDEIDRIMIDARRRQE